MTIVAGSETRVTFAFAISCAPGAYVPDMAETQMAAGPTGPARDPRRVSEPDRAARGKAARVAAPRSGQGAWTPAVDRADPVDVLAEQERTRTSELVPIRHGRMLSSPFAFFRGGAAIMAADLAATPVTGLRVQLCGDAHLANFGGFAAPDRSLVFDLNDFDETLPGPWEWDVKRLAASIAVAGRDRGFATDARGEAILAGVRAYREAMRGFAGMRTIDVWYARIDVDQQVARWSERATAQGRKRLDRTLAKARAKDSLRALAKLTHEVDGQPRIVSDPPLVVPIDRLLPAGDAELVYERLRGYLRAYEHSLQHDRQHLLGGYRLVDIAHKVVGVGSVGTRDWIALMLGRDASDPLFLQLKEADRSVLEPFAGRSRRVNQGRRVVEGQQLIQAGSDVLLGWLRVEQDLDGRRRDYYVRQLWDAKGSAPIDTMPADEMAAYAEICGWTLARAHARTGDRIAIAAYLGSSDRFERALVAFAETYADQNERDHEALASAVRAGAIAAEG
jgi:uncharacterized protein (DUF2252 family)